MLKRRSFLAGLLSLPAAPVAAKLIETAEPIIEVSSPRMALFDGNGRYLTEVAKDAYEVVFIKREADRDDPKMGRCFFFDKQTGKRGDRWWMFEDCHIRKIIQKVA